MTERDLPTCPCGDPDCPHPGDCDAMLAMEEDAELVASVRPDDPSTDDPRLTAHSTGSHSHGIPF